VPDTPGARYQLANLLFREGDAEATLDLIRPFMRAFQKAPNGWALRARAAESLEERQEAADCLQQS
jgi:predicted Zn-dependent protease